MSERENFEDAASRLGFNLTMAEHETGEYHYQVTQDAWDTWQEATYAAAREQEGGCRSEAAWRLADKYMRNYTVRSFPEGYTQRQKDQFSIECCVSELMHLLQGKGFFGAQSQGVPEGWKVWRDVDGYICIDSPRDAHVCWKRDENLADSHPMNMLADLGEALLSTPAAPQAGEWVKCDKQQLKAISSNLQYAGFNLCDNFDFSRVQGAKWRTVESTCPETSLLIAIRDLSELIGEPVPQPPEQEDGV